MASLIKRIARRLVRDEIPRQGGFPGASNSFPTWIAAVDEHRDPPRRLIDVSLQAVRLAMDEISLDDLAQRKNAPDYFTIWPGEHYRLLGAMVKLLAPKVVIEIGTDTGLSALVLKKFLPPGGKVVTFDLRPWETVEEHVLEKSDFEDGRLEQRLVDLSDPSSFQAHRSLIEQCGFFFVDGPKNIQFERDFMRQLAQVKFATPPIMLFDDTHLSCMVGFMRDLKHPKLDLTGFGHWSGTALVEMV